jgi:hypothetical protein
LVTTSASALSVPLLHVESKTRRTSSLGMIERERLKKCRYFFF